MKEVLIIKKFIDFDKEEEVFYNNLYLDDEKIVVKLPIAKNGKTDNVPEKGMKIEEFNLSNSIFILNY